MRDFNWVFFGRLPWSGVWLNRHYVSRELSRRDRVVYALDPRPLNPIRGRRGRDEARWGGIGSSTPPAGIELVRVPEAPLQRLGFLRRMTEGWTARRIRRQLAGDARTVLVYLPRARLLPHGRLGEALTVYYCSDDFRHLPDGTPDEAFIEWEKRALERSGLVIGVSQTLVGELERRHPRVRLVENGVDLELFRPGSGPPPADVMGLGRPRIGYVGTIRAPTIDMELMIEAATRRPDWTFCLVGWFDAGDPDTARLQALGNVHLTGPRPREVLARYIEAMDVVTCPYPDCPVTPGRSPLKAWEAMAVGRPLVATNAPTLNDHRPMALSAEGVDGFLAGIEEMLGDPPSGGPAAAAEFSWARRAERFRGHVDQALSKSPST